MRTGKACRVFCRLSAMGSDVTGVYWAAGSMDAALACSGCREYTTEISEVNDSFIEVSACHAVDILAAISATPLPLFP